MPPAIPKTKWKIGIIAGEIESYLEAMDEFEAKTPEEREERTMTMEIIATLERWAHELKGPSPAQASKEDLEWRADFLGEQMNMWSAVLEEEESLDPAERTGIEEDLVKLGQWRDELARPGKKTR